MNQGEVLDNLLHLLKLEQSGEAALACQRGREEIKYGGWKNVTNKWKTVWLRNEKQKKGQRERERERESYSLSRPTSWKVRIAGLRVVRVPCRVTCRTPCGVSILCSWREKTFNRQISRAILIFLNWGCRYFMHFWSKNPPRFLFLVHKYSKSSI